MRCSWLFFALGGLGHVGQGARHMAAKRKPPSLPGDIPHHFTSPHINGPRFLSPSTERYLVNGSAIPEVDFDVGESYAGMLSIGSEGDDVPKLFFWFFPSTNKAADKEILIWLNGGPGCSSLTGLLQENGPFQWQYGTSKPYPNPWSWHTLTNVIWVEQPVGTGFSTGNVTIKSEEDVAAQFMGFWRNFVDLFGIQGYKVYISGESYAGKFCPYIASAFLDANDKEHYDLSGMLLYDPLITEWDIIQPIPLLPFVNNWRHLLPYNDTFRAWLQETDASCGYSAWLDKYLVYPPAGHIPHSLPGLDKANGQTRETCANFYNFAVQAATLINPCFDVYNIATTCPVLWDVLGFPGTFEYEPKGATVYFDRADVKAAIHAPNATWKECFGWNVFVDKTDTSASSSFSVLGRVIDATKNVIIGHGALDMMYMANGTLIGIQNMSWGGQIGFQTRPVEPFYVPYHKDTITTLAGAGVLGTVHTERGLTYVGIAMSGHMVPQYSPSAAYRNTEFLLGRVDCMNCTKPFTSHPTYPQSTDKLGHGIAP